LTAQRQARLDLPDAKATIRLGTALADSLPRNAAGWTVLLDGELGAGKSTLARAFLHGRGHRGPVPSPTYTLVEPYELPGLDVFHIDLYRIASEDELRYLGFNELETGLRLVEWPARAPGLASIADLEVRLDYAGSGREATLVALSERAEHWLGEVASVLQETAGDAADV
jgi:tRNA threonylcarbamoyladenosine biosynthesis protein TsaE